MKPLLLSLIPLPRETLDALTARYEVHNATSPEDLPNGARAVVTNGTTGLSKEAMQRLPDLGLVCSFGAGYENIDRVAAAARGIIVSNAPGTNVATVADHAIGFLLALTRRQEALSQAVKSGHWATSRAARPTLTGATIGIVGMGRVGRLVARRAAAFDMTVNYFDVVEQDSVDGRYFSDVTSLAKSSDFLVLTCPGGKATYHLVGREVLQSLGPDGYLVNVARGTVVDTDALVQALADNEIAGAALDVIENEPEIPAQLMSDDRVLITPHMAGRSPASFNAQTDALLSSLLEYFTGTAVTRAIPAPA